MPYPQPGTMQTPSITRHSTVRRTFPFFLSYLFIYLFTFLLIRMESQILILFTGLPSIPASHRPRFGQWEPLQAASYVLLSWLPVSSEHFLTSWHSKRPSWGESSHFSKRGNGIWKIRSRWEKTFFLTSLLLNGPMVHFFRVTIIYYYPS